MLAACRHRRRAARQAGGRGRGESAHRPWRPDGAALHPGLPPRGIRSMKPTAHPTADHAQLGGARPRPLPSHQLRRPGDGVLSVPPHPRSRADAVMDQMRAAIDADGYGFAAVEIAETGESIGFVGLSMPLRSPAMSRGKRSRSAGGWRRNIGARAMSPKRRRRCSISASMTLGLDEIISFAVATTAARSPSCSASACADRATTSTIRACPDTHPHLKPQRVLPAVARMIGHAVSRDDRDLQQGAGCVRAACSICKK